MVQVPGVFDDVQLWEHQSNAGRSGLRWFTRLAGLVLVASATGLVFDGGANEPIRLEVLSPGYRPDYGPLAVRGLESELRTNMRPLRSEEALDATLAPG